MKRVLKTSTLVILAAILIRCGGSEEPPSPQATVTSPITYGQGFYGDESFPGQNGTVHHFRWMGLSGTAQLPPAAASATLKLTIGVPVETLSKKPDIAITLNGVAIESFTATKPSYDRAYPLASTQLHADQPNTLTFSTTQTIVPNTVTNGKNPDARSLGLKITDLRLEPGP